MRYIQGIALQKSFIILSPKIENWSVFNELQKQLDERSDVILRRQPFFFFFFFFGVNRAKTKNYVPTIITFLRRDTCCYQALAA